MSFIVQWGIFKHKKFPINIWSIKVYYWLSGVLLKRGFLKIPFLTQDYRPNPICLFFPFTRDNVLS